MRKNNLKDLFEGRVLTENNCYNFFDWFCKDSSLKRRAENLVPKIKFLVKELNLDLEKYTSFFKNNCPLCGSLYETFWIELIENEDVFLCVVPTTGYYGVENKTSIFLKRNDEVEEIEFKNWSTFKKELKENSELKEKIENYIK